MLFLTSHHPFLNSNFFPQIVLQSWRKLSSLKAHVDVQQSGVRVDLDVERNHPVGRDGEAHLRPAAIGLLARAVDGPQTIEQAQLVPWVDVVLHHRHHQLLPLVMQGQRLPVVGGDPQLREEQTAEAPVLLTTFLNRSVS